MDSEAVKLIRATKLRYPNVEAGTMVDPYIAAYDAAFNPEGPAFNAALRENLQYKIPPEGERLIADAQLFDLLVSRSRL